MSDFSGPRSAEGVVLFRHGDTAYELFQDLGLGRHGERILLARPRTPSGYQEKVVLKCLPLPQGVAVPPAHARARVRLEEEVRLARFLQHPGIARVHGLVELEHGLALVMESAEGLSLETLLTVAQARGRYFSEAFVLHVGAQAAGALAYAHTRTDDAGVPLGIVHRDLTPLQLRLRPSGGVKVTDFGVAFSRLAGRRATSLPRPFGEVLYAAPEALVGEVVDVRADLFSLGLTLLEFSTGRHLYDPGVLKPAALEARLSREQKERLLAASVTCLQGELPPFPEEALWCAMTYQTRDVAHATFGVSPALRAVFHKLLRRNPAERYASAAELEAELRAHLARHAPYGPQDAVGEVQEALVEAGEALEELDLLDEGGITAALLARHVERTPTRPERTVDPRAQDDLDTQPGEGRRRAPNRTPTA